ncbi:MAG: hypothetical protein Fur009_8120 [Candidatus Microgenomates bacterium]
MISQTNALKNYQKILENLYSKYLDKFKDKKIAVFVSGGIDSSLIAYFTSKFFKNITLLTLHSKNAVDLEYVKILNKYLRQKLEIVEFNDKKINQIKNRAESILKNNNLLINPTHLSLSSAFYLLCEKAFEEKIDVVFTGQGPDILLAGYHMYQKLPLDKLNEKIKTDLSLLEIDKKRDGAIAGYFKINLINPYLEKEFVDFCLDLPAQFKINKINNEVYEKYLSRKLGQILGLPKEIILRHKKALQYSTKIRSYFK